MRLTFLCLFGHVTDFTVRNKGSATKLLRQACRYNKIRKYVQIFIADAIRVVKVFSPKFGVRFKTFSLQYRLNPEFYDDSANSKAV